MLYNVNEADGIRKQTVYAPRGSGQSALAYPKPTRVKLSCLKSGVEFSLSRYTAWEISMLVLGGKGELMLIHGGVKNNYEHKYSSHELI